MTLFTFTGKSPSKCFPRKKGSNLLISPQGTKYAKNAERNIKYRGELSQTTLRCSVNFGGGHSNGEIGEKSECNIPFRRKVIEVVLSVTFYVLLHDRIGFVRTDCLSTAHSVEGKEVEYLWPA